ncbi:stabilizer of axonemal microtubules 3 [Pelodiscus sinensis]|uniref:stabilizer of axonemal microtubules 3 n=1 Tax=Pelodiscus sinensis TaxID=13735 RepID=UPI003F6B0921
MAGTPLPAPTGTDVGWSVAGARWHHRQDWPLSSSGVGLENRAPQPFPPPAARSTVEEPLPPGAEQHPQEQLVRRLASTTGLCHDVKTHGGVLGQPGAPLPAPLHKVHYNKDLRDKLQLRAWRVPLRPGGRSSETRLQFCGWPNLPPAPAQHPGPQPFALAAHHADGPSKSMVPSTQNKALAGSVFYIRDGAVLRRLDPNISVTTRDFRAFTPQELQGYARKDALTYWQWEGHPKAWGHGLREPPWGRDAEPLIRATACPQPPRLPMLAPAVPHRGALSLAQESYGPPRQAPSGLACLARPPTVCPPAAAPQMLAVPLMYRTESQSYGSNKPGPV